MPYMIQQPISNTAAPYVFFDKLFSDEECEKIIDLHKQLKKEIAKVGTENSEEGIKPEKRITDVYWFDWNQNTDWIYKRISESVFNANQTWWRFHLSGFNEPFQLTNYKGDESGHYDWHEDHAESGISLLRKISAVVLLNDEFEGGEFQFLHTGKPEEFKKGSLILFPSFKTHRVMPVTKGDRWSLVTWINGPPFC